MRSSGGIPRRINVLCHNALMLAFAEGEESAAGATCARRRSRLRPPAREQSVGAGEDGGVGERGDQIGVGEVRADDDAGGLAQARASRGGDRSVRGDVSAGDRRRGNFRAAALSRDSYGAVCAIRIARPSGRNRKCWHSGLQRNSRPDPMRTTKPAPKPISVAPLNVHDGSAGSANELIMRGPAEGSSTTDPTAPEQPKPETNPDRECHSR